MRPLSLPVVPPPIAGENLYSWLERTANYYEVCTTSMCLGLDLPLGVENFTQNINDDLISRMSECLNFSPRVIRTLIPVEVLGQKEYRLFASWDLKCPHCEKSLKKFPGRFNGARLCAVYSLQDCPLHAPSRGILNEGFAPWAAFSSKHGSWGAVFAIDNGAIVEFDELLPGVNWADKNGFAHWEMDILSLPLTATTVPSRHSVHRRRPQIGIEGLGVCLNSSIDKFVLSLIDWRNCDKFTPEIFAIVDAGMKKLRANPVKIIVRVFENCDIAEQKMLRNILFYAPLKVQEAVSARIRDTSRGGIKNKYRYAIAHAMREFEYLRGTVSQQEYERMVLEHANESLSEH